MSRAGRIDFVSGGPDGGADADPAEAMFIGGPRGGERAQRPDPPERIAEPGGYYERSVRCSDDGALRYVWRADGPPDGPRGSS